MTPKNKILEELSTEKVDVYGTEVMEDIYDIQSIEVYGDDINIDGVVDKLNKNSDAAGKNWMVLERNQDYSLIVSGIFDKKDSKYKSFGIQVDDEGLVFKIFEYNWDKKTDYRKEGRTKMLKNQAEGLIKILGDVAND